MLDFGGFVPGTGLTNIQNPTSNIVLSSRRFRNSPKTPLARVEFGYGVLQIRPPEIGPHLGGEQQLGIGAFPQQEIAQTLLAAGADQQIYVGSIAQQPRKLFA